MTIDHTKNRSGKESGNAAVEGNPHFAEATKHAFGSKSAATV